MSEEIYAKPDLTKKVRFQAGEKEDAGTDDYKNIENVTIYDNVWVEGSTAPTPAPTPSPTPSPTAPQEDKPEQQEQESPPSDSDSLRSEKRNLLRAAAVSLALLCLLLLAAVIVSTVLSSQHRREWISGMRRLWGDNANLTSQRDELQSRSHNMTQQMNGLESKIDLLNDQIDNITTQRDQLQELMKACCPADWIKFGSSCYFFSTSRRNWHNSRKECQNLGADLLIISNLEEHRFFNKIANGQWIGLTDEVTEGVWKWVDESTPTETYWGKNQPDNYKPKSGGEDCAVIQTDGTDNSWNDLNCNDNKQYVCERALKLH